MKILIVEDEPIIAQRLKRLIKAYFEDTDVLIHHKEDLDDALDYLSTTPIDVLFLDLNLHGEDGFELLKEISANSFHTIIVSAYSEKAITAFEYGVLDFIAKPFTQDRINKALDRLSSKESEHTSLKQLSFKSGGEISFVAIKDVERINADGHYSQVISNSGESKLHDKNLEKLSQLLPKCFIRVHRSFVVDINKVETILVESGGSYHLKMHSGALVPVSRSKYQDVKAQLSAYK